MARSRRGTAHGLGLMFDMARLGTEAWMVIGLRMAKFAAGGPAAAREAERMVTEKAAAAVEAQVAAGTALLRGASARTVQRKAASGYLRRVKANRRRLSRQ